MDMTGARGAHEDVPVPHGGVAPAVFDGLPEIVAITDAEVASVLTPRCAAAMYVHAAQLAVAMWTATADATSCLHIGLPENADCGDVAWRWMLCDRVIGIAESVRTGIVPYAECAADTVALHLVCCAVAFDVHVSGWLHDQPPLDQPPLDQPPLDQPPDKFDTLDAVDPAALRALLVDEELLRWCYTRRLAPASWFDPLH